MEMLVGLLRPIFSPLLRISSEAPHLPEGSTLVRHLRPTQQWLTYKYLKTLFGLLNQFIGVGAAAVLLLAQLGRWGIAVALLLLAVEFVVIGVSLVGARVDFELRHYLVGDRSLRVVQGIFRREEVTLSYANVQNLEVRQGPLERLFGFKSLSVSTAGADASPEDTTSHVVTMVGLSQADELKELIMGMLRRHRDTGLGDTSRAGPADGRLDFRRLEEIRQAAVALRNAAVARSKVRPHV